ncbi:MAG: aminoacetone oxidase family FAD-binding enzyme [Patescibacteria group bacterium]|nr:aminoacetone oxidase family FAD-binding enzyme [Patescibacteria group bacterium]
MKNYPANYDVIVIGGGAAGMMAAGRAAENGRRVLLLEKNKNLGEKLKLTGGGRCNITNAEENKHLLLAKYGTAGKALHSAFAQFGVEDTFKFFANRGLPLIVQANQRAFPKTEKALDVLLVLEKYLKQGNVKICSTTKVKKIVGTDKKIEKIITDQGDFSAASYILATGGKSHPETGSTGDGFIWLEQLGHNIKVPTPTVVPIAVADNWIKQLSGLTLPRVKIIFYTAGRKSLTLKGDILLTHFGLSGPLILNAAGKIADFMHDGEVTAIIDMFPQLDLGGLDKHLTKIFNEHKNKELKNVFKFFVPDGTTKIILRLLKFNPDLKVHSVTRDQRKKIVNLLKTLPVKVTGLMGHDRAVITDGGVTLTEIDVKTMRSKLYDNLFIIGDLLHISRPSGGYSLQLCWTTGFIAGSNA